jgi:hypothetical protein
MNWLVNRCPWWVLIALALLLVVGAAVAVYVLTIPVNQ